LPTKLPPSPHTRLYLWEILQIERRRKRDESRRGVKIQLEIEMVLEDLGGNIIPEGSLRELENFPIDARGVDQIVRCG
jgi:hypothetical protein